jgi:hypothetical protein
MPTSTLLALISLRNFAGGELEFFGGFVRDGSSDRLSANVDADVRSRGAFLHFDNLAFELVASAEFHGSLLSLAAGDNP